MQQSRLEAAIEALETVATEDDATELNEAIAAAEEHLDIPYYTADSYAAFEKAYNKAVVVAGDLEAGVAYSSEDIQKVTTKLNDAVEGLTEKEGLWIEKIEDQVYTGSAIKPTVVVWDGATCLDPKKDYKVSYKKNINVGEATITVTGKGNYAKKDTFTFDIVKKDIENLDATDNEVIIANVYTTIKNNKVSNPKVTAKYGKKTMKLNKDYTVTYPEIPVVSGTPVAGDYEIVIKGIGNYTGVTTINYEVRTETVLMSKAKVKPSTSIVTYAGEETVKPTVTVTIGGVTLTEWNGETGDYTVDYTGFDQIGKATVTVTAVEGSKYYGSKSVKYTVKGNTLSKGTMTVSGCDAEGYPYTGEEIKIDEIDTIEVIDKKNPLVDVSGNEMPNVLTKGVDYEITYSNNTNVGKKATMTITGINAYAGTLKTTFKITALNLNTANVEGSDLEIVAPTTATYTKTGAVPEYSITYKGEELQFKKDYTMKVSNNKKAGNTATIILTGKGNFTGTFSWTYNVEKPAVEDIEEAFTITATDVLFNKNTKAEKLSSKITVVENETGKKLAAKTDYVKVTAADYYVVDADGRRAVAQSDLVADQIIYVDVTLTGNYEGTLTTSFRLYDKKMSSVYVAKIGPEIYTGSEIEPEVKVYVDKAMTTPLDEAYYEVSYNKNVTKGTAKVTITGVGGGYGGTKTVTFKINAEDMNWAEEAMKGIASFFANLFN